MNKIFIEDYKSIDFDNLKADVVVSPFLPSSLIEKLRKRGVVYIKANSLKEIEGFEFEFLKEKRIKRGVGCSGKF